MIVYVWIRSGCIGVRIVISHGFFSKPKAAAGTDDTHTHHYNSLAVSHASQQPWQYHAPSLRSTLRAPTEPMAAPVRTMRTMLSDAGAPQWTCTMAGARSTRMARNRAAAHAQVAVEVVAAVAHPTRGMGQTPCCTWLWRICRCQAGSNPHAEHIAQWSALWKAAAATPSASTQCLNWPAKA